MAVDLAEIRVDLSEELPFPLDEYEDRGRRARVALERTGLDAVVLFDPASIYYFSGFHSVNLWDLAAVVIPVDGPLRVLLWEFELARAEVSMACGSPLPYAVTDDPAQRLVEFLRSIKVESYGIDDWTSWSPTRIVNQLRASIPSVRAADARPLLQATRLRKSALELDMLRAAARVTDIGFAAALDAADVGVTDHELAASAAAAMLRSGSGHFAIQPIVAVGPRAGVMHSEASGRSIRQGEGIFLELGASIRRYTAPLMRTIVIGTPEAELVHLASAASQTLAEVVSAIQPGVRCSEVARIALEVISVAAPELRFHGYVGYPVGAAFPPSWIEDLDFYVNLQSTLVIDEGMVLHLPLTLREIGTRGVGLSYTLVVQRDGVEVLTHTPGELILR